MHRTISKDRKNRPASGIIARSRLANSPKGATVEVGISRYKKVSEPGEPIRVRKVR